MHSIRIFRRGHRSVWFETPRELWQWSKPVQFAFRATLLIALLGMIGLAQWSGSRRFALNLVSDYLPDLLKSAAAGQALIAVLNLFLVRMMDWRDDVERMPLLIREVFRVHAWFISITLGIFSAMSWRFADQISGGDAMGKWLAGGIGIFWAIRAVLQITFYSSTHWRGRLDRTLIHIALLLTYGGFAAIYLCAALLKTAR